ncbi:hypothetical protein LTR53_004075 [Teratosphaeriaceae sp. CCFEE 6253]|nr:hypothetical protein LTR53_004075 [Teratosphaeriaceae sp. CCFEE 6253]
MTMHPDIGAGKALLEQNDLATLLGHAVTRRSGPTTPSYDRVLCGSHNGQPCWMSLRTIGEGGGCTVQFESDVPIPTGKAMVETGSVDDQNTNTNTSSKIDQSKDITVTFTEAGVASDCRFPRYLNPELWTPSSTDATYKKVGHTAADSEQEWRRFLVEVYKAACPEGQEKHSLKLDEEEEGTRKLNDGSTGGPAPAEDEAFPETDEDEEDEEDEEDKVRKEFAKLYLTLRYADQIWNVYDYDLDTPRLDLSLEVVCRRLSMAWCELHPWGRTVGPEAKLLRDALDEKRKNDLDRCDSSDAFTLWIAKGRSGSRTVTLRNKYKFVPAMEQFATGEEADRMAAARKATRQSELERVKRSLA